MKTRLDEIRERVEPYSEREVGHVSDRYIEVYGPGVRQPDNCLSAKLLNKVYRLGFAAALAATGEGGK